MLTSAKFNITGNFLMKINNSLVVPGYMWNENWTDILFLSHVRLSPLGGIGGSNSLGGIVLRTVLKLFYFHFIGWKLKHLKPIWFIFLNATTVMSSSRTFLFISLFCYTTNHDLFDSTNTLRCLIKGGSEIFLKCNKQGESE